LPLSPGTVRLSLTGLSAILTGVSIYWIYSSAIAIVAPLIILLTSLYAYNALPILDEDFEKTKHKDKDAAHQLVTD
jgi:hypothetical protein